MGKVQTVRFVRTYQQDGTEYICGVFCDIRGPGIEDRPIAASEITCPNCLAVSATVEKYCADCGRMKGVACTCGMTFRERMLSVQVGKLR